MKNPETTQAASAPRSDEDVLITDRSLLIRSTPGERSGISPATVPGTKIAMIRYAVSAGGEDVPDCDRETAVFVLEGRGQVSFGDNYESSVEVNTGDFYFTPAHLGHVVRNSHDAPLVLIAARSLDPSLDDATAPSEPPEARVKVVHAAQDARHAAQTRGMVRQPAISAATVGATQIWMCRLAVQPNGRGQPHHHGHAHTAAYTISGTARICFGDDCRDYIELVAGDFAFDPPGLVHLVDQVGGEPWKGVLARCPENTVVNVDQ